VTAERDRIARDLHDGMAQDLAFIARRAGADALVSEAARRALAGARRTIGALRAHGERDLAAQLRAVAALAGVRVGVETEVVVDAGVRLEPEEADAVLGIVAEAVTNAGRHGRASSVTIELTGDPCLRLRISDDGAGFVTVPPAGRFGVVGMHERAHRIGGRLSLGGDGASGAVVEVVV
jgi:signal transduction histidine kinase